MNPEALIAVLERADLSFNDKENKHGIITIECKQRRVTSCISGNNGTWRCDSTTVIIPLNSPDDALTTCRLSNATGTERDGQLFGVGAAVLIDYSHHPVVFHKPRNVDVVCRMMDSTI